MKKIIGFVGIAGIVLVSNVFGVLSGGGTETNPYLIQSRADFNEFANPANAALYWASGVYTKLMCDLDLSDTLYLQAVIAPDMDYLSYDFQGVRFAGNFNGNNCTLSNIVIDTNLYDYVGLFGNIDSGGIVSNLGIVNINVKGKYYVGGLAGYNWGSIIACYAAGVVNGYGGLVGYNQGSITASYAMCAVSGANLLGGLVGYNQGSITACYASGAVNGTGSEIGGLVGYGEYGSITDSYAAGSVSGHGDVGGLVGYTYHDTLTHCYAAGKVSGYSKVGGLCGNGYGTVVKGCFWDMETSGQSTSKGGVGKTTAKMKLINTFLLAGWDFTGEKAKGTKDIWRMITSRYPVHSWTDAFVLNTAAMTITEGQTAGFEVVLPSAPEAEVSIHLSIAGSSNFELLTAATLVFDSNNWNVPQSVSVKSAEDNNYFNDNAVLVLLSKDFQVQLPLREMDTQPELPEGVIVVSSEELSVQEGSEASFTVMLAEDPLQTTQIYLTLKGDPNLSIISNAVLSFDSNNYTIPQTVTVKARWDMSTKDAQALLLLSSPELPERLFQYVGVAKKNGGKILRLSKPVRWLDAIGVTQTANASYLNETFIDTSDAVWYTFGVAGVPGIPGVKGTRGYYTYVTYPIYHSSGWVTYKTYKIWHEGTPGRPAVPAKNRACITFTGDPSLSGAVWVAVYQQVDSQYKLVKAGTLKQGKSSKFKFIGKADVDYYVCITPVDNNLGSYSISVAKEAIR